MRDQKAITAEHRIFCLLKNFVDFVPVVKLRETDGTLFPDAINLQAGRLQSD